MEKIWFSKNLEGPKGNSESKMTFLGCEQTLVETDINGKKVRVMKWDVSHSMKRCVPKYEATVQQCTGSLPRMVHADTPFLPDETKHVRSRAPTTNESCIECPACMDIFTKSIIEKKFTFAPHTKRSIRKLPPMIGKDDCRYTG